MPDKKDFQLSDLPALKNESPTNPAIQMRHEFIPPVMLDLSSMQAEYISKIAKAGLAKVNIVQSEIVVLSIAARAMPVLFKIKLIEKPIQGSCIYLPQEGKVNFIEYRGMIVGYNLTQRVVDVIIDATPCRLSLDYLLNKELVTELWTIIEQEP